MRLVRSDTLPENGDYPDKGCELAAACLECPLPICKEDNPTLNARLQKADRDRAIVKARGKKLTIAKRFGISTRTVYRIRMAHRNGFVSTTLAEAEGDADMTLEELAQTSRFRAPEPWPQLLLDQRLASEREQQGG